VNVRHRASAFSLRQNRGTENPRDPPHGMPEEKPANVLRGYRRAFEDGIGRWLCQARRRESLPCKLVEINDSTLAIFRLWQQDSPTLEIDIQPTQSENLAAFRCSLLARQWAATTQAGVMRGPQFSRLQIADAPSGGPTTQERCGLSSRFHLTGHSSVADCVAENE
jgi:hypothetical protein